MVKKTDFSANTVTVTAAAGTEKINGEATFVLSAQHTFVEVPSGGTAWQVVVKE